MEDSTYNGWTNRSTWLVNLWIDNEEGTYNEKVEFLKSGERTIFGHGQEVSAEEAEEIATDLLGLPPCAHFQPTVGFFADGGKLAEVDWKDIAQSWTEERHDIIRYE